jgi:hypothetical protein
LLVDLGTGCGALGRMPHIYRMRNRRCECSMISSNADVNRGYKSYGSHLGHSLVCWRASAASGRLMRSAHRVSWGHRSDP